MVPEGLNSKPRNARHPHITMPSWTYNEFKHIGVDFDDPRQIETYETRQKTSLEDERELVARLGIGSGHHVLEFGPGTGAFAIAAAEAGARVLALDISQGMLTFAAKKATAAGLDAIKFRKGSFLSHDLPHESLDFVITKFALHHLPDFWKVAALRRIFMSLRMSGRLYIQDVVFSFEPDSQEREIESWIESATRSGSFSRSDFEMHVRDEYSTYGPLMEAMLGIAGFRISLKNYYSKVQAEYLCERA
jgi:ubiquinone/menaquinone biosynthesis C-methylase UbiE